MSKNNKIFFVILTFVVSIMIGYALFSETVTLSGTATAQGQFKITTTCNPGVSGLYATQLGFDIASDLPEGGYEEEYCTVNGSDVLFGSNLLYPTAQRFFTIKIKNTGSINVLLDPEKDLIIEEGEVCADTDGNGTYEECLDASELPDSYKFVNLNNESLTPLDPSNQVPADESEYLTEDGYLILKPNYSLMFLVYTTWPDDFSGSDYEGVTFKHKNMSVKFNFVQETIN